MKCLGQFVRQRTELAYGRDDHYGLVEACGNNPLARY
jgi:hypothetical protein